MTHSLLPVMINDEFNVSDYINNGYGMEFATILVRENGRGYRVRLSGGSVANPDGTFSVSVIFEGSSELKFPGPAFYLIQTQDQNRSSLALAVLAAKEAADNLVTSILAV